MGFPRLAVSRCYRAGGAMPGASLLATRWIEFPVVLIRAPRELAIGNVGRPVERLGPLALPVDIGCLARRTGRGYDEGAIPRLAKRA